MSDPGPMRTIERAAEPRRAPREVEYPESDGKPMAEHDTHRKEMQEYAIEVLEDHFYGQRDDVYVTGNNFLYYVEGKPKRCVSPDTYVVFGVPKGPRGVFKTWEEGDRVPAFALEVTSKKTRLQDLGRKMAVYRDDLRIGEYVLFDPFGDWIPERLRAFRLVEGEYRAMARDPKTGRVRSSALELDLGVVDGHLRFFAPGAERPLPTRVERAHAEAEQARAATEQARAATEQARAATEEARAERARADDAERELERLRAELAKLRASRGS